MRLTRKLGERYAINKSGVIFEAEDFSPTWALTKEELEK